MNYAFLIKKISLDLYATVRLFNGSGELIQTERPDPDIMDDDIAHELMQNGLFLEENPDDPPLVASVNEGLIYGFIKTAERHFLVGPIRFFYPADIIHAITLDVPTKSLYSLVSQTSMELFDTTLLLVSNLTRAGEGSEPFFTDEDLLNRNYSGTSAGEDLNRQLTNVIFENVENSFAHNPYNHEKRELDCIRNGNVEELKEILKERFPGRYGRLSRDPVRQEINIGIVAVTIAIRAAIDGGVHPETAFYLSDVTISKLDICHDPLSALRISQNCELQCASMVAELKKKKAGNAPDYENRHISHCKDYIFSHLHGKITVSEIASAIGLEANYLSALFRRCEDITLKEYIRHEKIKLVKNLLIYSSYSYNQIATYLGFPSQSYMGQEFKKETGMTPRIFRERFAREDFMNDSLFSQ